LDKTKYPVDPWFDAEHSLEQGMLSGKAPPETELVQSIVEPEAPDGLCEKHTDKLPAAICQQVVKGGDCDEKITDCAATCCNAGFWTALSKEGKRFLYSSDVKQYQQTKAFLTVQPKEESATAFQNEVETAAANAIKMAKAQAEAIGTALEELRRHAQQPVQRVAAALAKKMPELKSIAVSRIYLQCLFWPQECDPKVVEVPEITVCFTYMGCLSSNESTMTEKPTMSTFLEWIKTEAQKATLDFFESLLEFESTTLKMPDSLEYIFQEVTVGGKGKTLQLSTGRVETVPLSIRYPVAVKESALQAFENAPTESRDDVDKNDILPAPFTPNGVVDKVLDKVTDSDEVYNTMGSGIDMKRRKSLTAEANKNIEADDEEGADAQQKADLAEEAEAVKEAEQDPTEQRSYNLHANAKSSDDSASQPVNIDMVGSAKVPDGDDDSLDHLTIDGDDHLVEPETSAPKHAVSESASMEDIVEASTVGATTTLGKASLHQKPETAQASLDNAKKQYEQAQEALGEDEYGIDSQSAGIDNKYTDVNLFHSAASKSAHVKDVTDDNVDVI